MAFLKLLMNQNYFKYNNDIFYAQNSGSPIGLSLSPFNFLFIY